MTVWKEALGWTYRVLDAEGRDCDVAPPFRSLVDLWRSKSAPGRLPAWRDFSFEDFDGWHG